ncbi:hypothetical protein I2709_003820 [Vibrio mimicus]|nr:hypothetical protein [Vibrio cholerae]TXX97155.1 hypothetical protein FXF05_20300 [Vibrio mimicus]EGQ9396197.1 hypothetical protein [Vibrio cholerae]EGQ9613137.1 hypothetical protein [Vibrio cholerae]EGR2831958.1 hypothetical protein [Vibrio cholerae]
MALDVCLFDAFA